MRSSRNGSRIVAVAAVLAVTCAALILVVQLAGSAFPSGDSFAHDEIDVSPTSPDELLMLTKAQRKRLELHREKRAEEDLLNSQRAAQSKSSAATALHQIFKAISKQGQNGLTFAKLEKEMQEVKAEESKVNSKLSLSDREKLYVALAKKARTAAVAAQLDYGEKAGQEAKMSDGVEEYQNEARDAANEDHLAKLNVVAAKKSLTARLADQISAHDEHDTAVKTVAIKLSELKAAKLAAAKAHKLAVEKIAELHKATSAAQAINRRAKRDESAKTRALRESEAAAQAELDAARAAKHAAAEALSNAASTASKVKKMQKKISHLVNKREGDAVAAAAAPSRTIDELTSALRAAQMREDAAKREFLAAQHALRAGTSDAVAENDEQRAAAAAALAEAHAQSKLASDASSEADDNVAAAQAAYESAQAEVAATKEDEARATQAVAQARSVIAASESEVKTAGAAMIKAQKEAAMKAAEDKKAHDDAAAAMKSADELDHAADSLEHKVRKLKHEIALAAKAAAKKAEAAKKAQAKAAAAAAAAKFKKQKVVAKK